MIINVIFSYSSYKLRLISQSVFLMFRPDDGVSLFVSAAVHLITTLSSFTSLKKEKASPKFSLFSINRLYFTFQTPNIIIRDSSENSRPK